MKARTKAEQCSACVAQRAAGEQIVIKRATYTVPACRNQSQGLYLCSQHAYDKAEAGLEIDVSGNEIYVNPANPTESIDWVLSGLKDYDPECSTTNLPKGLPSFFFIDQDGMLARRYPVLSASDEEVNEMNVRKCNAAAVALDKERSVARATMRKNGQENNYRRDPNHPSCCPVCGHTTSFGYIPLKNLTKEGLSIDAFRILCAECTSVYAEKHADEHGDISSKLFIEETSPNEIDLFKIKFVAYDEDEALPSDSPNRFIMSVIPKSDMNVDPSTEEGKTNVTKMYKVYDEARERSKKLRKRYHQRECARAMSLSAAMGNANDLGETAHAAATALFPAFLEDANFDREEDLVDVNRFSVLEEDGVVTIMKSEQFRKVWCAAETPFVHGDGTLLRDTDGMISFTTVAKDEEYEEDDDPSPIHAMAKIICDPTSHSSAKKLEEAVQVKALEKDSTTRRACLNDDTYHPGSTSDIYRHGAVGATVYKRALKAVLDENVDVYLNYHMAPDIKNRLRLYYPELNDHKYWRCEKTGARAKRKKSAQNRRNNKKQKTEE